MLKELQVRKTVHSDRHQATNSQQEQFQIQSLEIQRVYITLTWQGADFQIRYSKQEGNKKLQLFFF